MFKLHSSRYVQALLSLILFLPLGWMPAAIAAEQPISTSTMWEVSNLIAEGRKEMRRGNPEKALPLFERARQLNPNFATAIALVAQAKAYEYWHINRDDLSEALVAQKMLSHPVISKIAGNKARANKRQEHVTHQDVKAMAEKALVLDVSNTDARIALVMAYRTIPDLEEMDRQLDLLPDARSALALSLRGDVCLTKGYLTDFELLNRAIQYYEQALALEPELYDALVGLGTALSQLFLVSPEGVKGDSQRILGIGQLLIRINPAKHDGYDFIIDAAYALGDSKLTEDTKSWVKKTKILPPREMKFFSYWD